MNCILCFTLVFLMHLQLIELVFTGYVYMVASTGLYSSLPQVFKLLMALVTGALSDWLIAKDYLTITSGRKIFVALGE